MRFTRLALLGAFSLFASAGAACSSITEVPKITGGSTGSGGAGSTSTTASTAASSSGGAGAADAGTDADNGKPSTMYPAPHDTPPQVFDYGGPVLASPVIVPVFFANHDPTFKMQQVDFAAKIGATQYWAAATAEYGVGPATSTKPVELTEMAPTSLDDATIQTWLADKLDTNDPLWPKADANTVYVLHYPAGVNISLGGQGSCQSFYGYHSDTTLDAAHGGISVAYAVIPDCESSPPFTGIDSLTATESHELVEAVTDPYPMANAAYASVDEAHLYWQRILGGSENGDMCAQFQASFTKFPELPYVVQRAWSNKAANAGHDPCVPALPGEVYFNAVPKLDTVPITFQGQSISVKAVKIPVGMTKTIELDLFSDGDTKGPWTVSVKDTTAAFGGTAHLALSLDKNTGVNGEKLHLTITVMTAGKNKTESFIVSSKLNGADNIWIGEVAQ